jgi:hypothetical protein
MGLEVMSTTTNAPPTTLAAQTSPKHASVELPLGEQRMAIRGVPWNLYDALSDAIGERQRVYLAYDGKDLEILTKGRMHEDYKDLFGQLMHAVADEVQDRAGTANAKVALQSGAETGPGPGISSSLSRVTSANEVHPARASVRSMSAMRFESTSYTPFSPPIARP